MYGIALLPLTDNKSILRKVIFVFGSGTLSMVLAIVPGLYGAGHSPIEPNAAGYFTYTSIQKFMVGSISGALLLAF